MYEIACSPLRTLRAPHACSPPPRASVTTCSCRGSPSVTWISPLLRFLVQLGYITEITETLLLALGDFYAKMLASVVLMQVCIYIKL